MNGDNIIREVEVICFQLRKDTLKGIETLKVFIPMLQGVLSELMSIGIEKGIEQNEWIIVLTDIVDAMKREDRVLLIDVLEYGFLELVRIVYGIEKGEDYESGDI